MDLAPKVQILKWDLAPKHKSYRRVSALKTVNLKVGFSPSINPNPKEGIQPSKNPNLGKAFSPKNPNLEVGLSPKNLIPRGEISPQNPN